MYVCMYVCMRCLCTGGLSDCRMPDSVKERSRHYTVKLRYNVLGYNVPSVIRVITDVTYGPQASKCPAYNVLYNGLTG